MLARRRPGCVRRGDQLRRRRLTASVAFRRPQWRRQARPRRCAAPAPTDVAVLLGDGNGYVADLATSYAAGESPYWSRRRSPRRSRGRPRRRPTCALGQRRVAARRWRRLVRRRDQLRRRHDSRPVVVATSTATATSDIADHRQQSTRSRVLIAERRRSPSIAGDGTTLSAPTRESRGRRLSDGTGRATRRSADSSSACAGGWLVDGDGNRLRSPTGNRFKIRTADTDGGDLHASPGPIGNPCQHPRRVAVDGPNATAAQLNFPVSAVASPIRRRQRLHRRLGQASGSLDAVRTDHDDRGDGGRMHHQPVPAATEVCRDSRRPVLNRCVVEVARATGAGRKLAHRLTRCDHLIRWLHRASRWQPFGAGRGAPGEPGPSGPPAGRSRRADRPARRDRPPGSARSGGMPQQRRGKARLRPDLPARHLEGRGHRDDGARDALAERACLRAREGAPADAGQTAAHRARARPAAAARASTA